MVTIRPHLKTLIFEVTQRCNHACLHCYNFWQPDADYFSGELDTASTISLLAKALDETDCQHITLTGGEPLLRQDLLQILDFLRARGARATIVSNGRLLGESTVVDLLDHRVGLFELPLLSCTREMHDRLSGVPGAFDAVLAAMAHVRYHQGQFVAVFVATRLNLPDLYGAIKLAYAFGARGFMLNRFNVGGRGRKHVAELLPSPEQLRDALAIADAASAEFNFPVVSTIPIQPCLVDIKYFKHLSFGFCAIGTDRVYYTLDPLGNVRPCNHTPTILGNLFDNPFEALIASEKMSAFVNAAPAFCSPCTLRSSCQGGCKAAAQVSYGGLDEEEPFLRYNQDSAQVILS